MSDPNQTVVITTKNTPALTMGIIAIVLGVLALLVSWIPFVGLIAIPVAVIGGLLALIGLILAAVKGFKGWAMPVLGGIICTLCIIVSMSSTGAVSSSIAKATNEASQKRTVEAEATKAYVNQIEVKDVSAKYRDSVLDGRVAGVTFSLKNNGDRTVKRVNLTCYFLGANGKPVAEESFSPISSFGLDSKPLKPGYGWSFPENRFFSAKSVPKDWVEGSVRLEVNEVELE